MKPIRMIALAAIATLALLAATVLIAGCGVGTDVGDGGLVSTTDEPTSTTATEPQQTTTTVIPETTTTTETLETTTFNVYFSRDEKMCATSRTVPKTTGVGAAAVKALLAGPTAEEQNAGMSSNIPAGTTFLGLNIKDGIATVDLSKEYASGGGSLSMAMRLAEVVFTLTQFPTVEGVDFMLDGKPVEVFGGEGLILDHPVNRSDYEDLSPAILVESPTFGQEVTSPMRIRGTANVFEAVFEVNIVDWDGLIIATKTVMASSGTSTRGTFDVTVPFKVDSTDRGGLIVFAESPMDGAPINVVEIPLRLVK